MNRGVFLNDTTLRDGEQAPGVSFTIAEKLELAESLAAAGIPEIEIGTPSMGGDEIETIRAAVARSLPVRLTAWCRMTSRDLEAAIESGVTAVNLSLPASDIQLAAKLGLDQGAALQIIAQMVGRAAAHGFSLPSAARMPREPIGIIWPASLRRPREPAQAASGWPIRSAFSTLFRPSRLSLSSRRCLPSTSNSMHTTISALRSPTRWQQSAPAPAMPPSPSWGSESGRAMPRWKRWPPRWPFSTARIQASS